MVSLRTQSSSCDDRESVMDARIRYKPTVPPIFYSEFPVPLLVRWVPVPAGLQGSDIVGCCGVIVEKLTQASTPSPWRPTAIGRQSDRTGRRTENSARASSSPVHALSFLNVPVWGKLTH